MENTFFISSFSCYHTRFNIYASFLFIPLDELLNFNYTSDFEIILIHSDNAEVKKYTNLYENSRIYFFSFSKFILYFQFHQKELNLKDLQDWLSFKIFLFIDLDWTKTIKELKENKIKISSGKELKNYFLTPEDYKLSQFCFLSKIPEQIVFNSFISKKKESSNTITKKKKFFMKRAKKKSKNKTKS